MDPGAPALWPERNEADLTPGQCHGRETSGPQADLGAARPRGAVQPPGAAGAYSLASSAPTRRPTAWPNCPSWAAAEAVTSNTDRAQLLVRVRRFERL
jgi:hypothetical protein